MTTKFFLSKISWPPSKSKDSRIKIKINKKVSFQKMKQKRNFFEKKKQNKRFRSLSLTNEVFFITKIGQCSLSLSLSLSLSFSLKHTLILPLPLAHTLSLPLLKTCENTHSTTLFLTRTHLNSLSASLVFDSKLCQSLSHAQCTLCPLSLSLSLIHTHTHYLSSL